MMCPYQNFKECDWENCAARMYTDSPTYPYNSIKVCALAYNGAPIPVKQEKESEVQNG